MANYEYIHLEDDDCTLIGTTFGCSCCEFREEIPHAKALPAIDETIEYYEQMVADLKILRSDIAEATDAQ